MTTVTAATAKTVFLSALKKSNLKHIESVTRFCRHDRGFVYEIFQCLDTGRFLVLPHEFKEEYFWQYFHSGRITGGYTNTIYNPQLWIYEEMPVIEHLPYEIRY